MTAPNHKDRGHALLSASSAARWLACPPSARAAALYPDTGSDYAAEGTLAHEVAEIIASGRDPEQVHPPDKLRQVTPEMLSHACDYADYIREQITKPDAVMLLERRVDFSAWVPDGFGTCDCIIIQGDELHVIDYKYGLGVQVSAEDNPQLKLYALGALNDYGVAYDIDRIILHIYQPRLGNISRYVLTTEQLLSWAIHTVRPTAALAYQGCGDYLAGDHCKFCPHAGKCPTLTQTCAELVEAHGMTGDAAQIQTLTPEAVAEVLRMEPLVQLWLKRVKAQAQATMLEGGEIPGYKLVEGRLGNRKWTDEIRVADALKAAGYSLEDITETKLLSPAAMDKALGKKRAAELLTDLTAREPGAPTIAPATDKRPTYNPAGEFDILED